MIITKISDSAIDDKDRWIGDAEGMEQLRKMHEDGSSDFELKPLSEFYIDSPPAGSGTNETGKLVGAYSWAVKHWSLYMNFDV